MLLEGGSGLLGLVLGLALTLRKWHRAAVGPLVVGSRVGRVPLVGSAYLRLLHSTLDGMTKEPPTHAECLLNRCQPKLAEPSRWSVNRQERRRHVLVVRELLVCR